MTECLHNNFTCKAAVKRLTDSEGGPVTGYTADIEINCADCGIPFRFTGLPAGSHYYKPRVSVDGTELRAPIEPANHEIFYPSPKYTARPAGK